MLKAVLQVYLVKKSAVIGPTIKNHRHFHFAAWQSIHLLLMKMCEFCDLWQVSRINASTCVYFWKNAIYVT
jgi:hypothetical protein